MKLYCRCFLCAFLFSAIALVGCDLQPKIVSIPDSIGDFIAERYPALLADPVTEPEIYNSAVTDYGVYASPELYGSDQDYLVYANIDDYVFTPSYEKEPEKIEQDIQQKPEPGITSKSEIVPDKESEIDEVEETSDNDYLSVPDYVAPKEIISETQNPDEVIIVHGDTLYSIAKKNNTTVAELANINSLDEQYTLLVGQKLKLRSAYTPEEVKIQPAKKFESVKIENAKIEPAKKVAPEIEKDIVKNESLKLEIKKAEKAKIVKPDTTNMLKQTNTKRIAVREITVAKGDTLYSLSRKYQIPVNDLAVMNKISSPFTLSVGQKIKVPKIDIIEKPVVTNIKKTETPQNKKEIQNSKKEIQNKKIEVSKRKTEVVKDKNVAQKTKKVESRSEKVAKKESSKTKISTEPKKQVPTIGARSGTKFSWPIRGRILSQFGAKNGGLFNDGINISGNIGTIVKAAENGVVAYAGNEVKGMGNLIIIQHSDGWMTVYAHLDSMVVRRGTKVTVGQQIGKIGKTGKVDSPQLHFEIRKGTKAYDPIKYLKK